jgi:hypothetical protein
VQIQVAQVDKLRGAIGITIAAGLFFGENGLDLVELVGIGSSNEDAHGD